MSWIPCAPHFEHLWSAPGEYGEDVSSVKENEAAHSHALRWLLQITCPHSVSQKGMLCPALLLKGSWQREQQTNSQKSNSSSWWETWDMGSAKGSTDVLEAMVVVEKRGDAN